MKIIYTDNQLDLSNLTRLPEVQTAYAKELKILSKKGENSLNLLGNRMFPIYMNISIMQNEYPYSLPVEYKHEVLWSKKELSLEDLQLILNFKNVVAIWENEGDTRSIPEIKHYHFVVKEVL